MAGLNAAYLANLALCLVVYSGAAGSAGSKIGWLISIVILWPMIVELAILLTSSRHLENVNPYVRNPLP